MTLYTRSWGIKNNKQLSQILGSEIKLFKSSKKRFQSTDVLLGWGHKANTELTRRISEQRSLPYWALEDGFIASIGHPSFEQTRLSLIKDEIGIYYDSRQPSALDYWLNNVEGWFDSVLARRAELAMPQCVKLQVSKYNQRRVDFPEPLRRRLAQGTPLTLVVDQTYGDVSISGAQASEKDFKRMLQWACEQAQKERGCVVLKMHPDVLLGKKIGHFAPSSIPEEVFLLTEDVSPAALISVSQRVVTVSSQLGFEALWQGKPVHCFGIPFYAQRGLTHDHALCEVARSKVTLTQLFAAAMFKYPTYWHPELDRPSEIEEVLDWMQAQFQAREPFTEHLDVVGVSLWKRSFVRVFIGQTAQSVRYIAKSRSLAPELHWGMKSQPADGTQPYLRMEDGFVRSVGLGADLRRPSSLVLDDLGIYYNGKQSSRLEQLLNGSELNDYERARAIRLKDLLIRRNITKYNVEGSNTAAVEALKQQAGQRSIVLVTGQFQDDLSIAYGTDKIKTNMDLLRAARAKYPEAFLIYKEHPDVYSGVRPGRLSDQEVESLADAYVTQVPLPELFSITDRLCTMCSLSGFEALLRGIKVSTFGLPFYAGWGLTDDQYSIDRRNKCLDITELVYATLVLYPRYVTWRKRVISTPEIIIEDLARQRHNSSPLRSSWLHRQLRKVKYFSEALLH